MSNFHWPRFQRLFLNDFLVHWRKIGIATLALLGIATISYLTNLNPREAEPDGMNGFLFPLVLFAGGVALTNTSFADMHHALQRFGVLTLPVSTLERFVSRYLQSGPLFYLYVLVVYALFDAIAALLTNALLGVHMPRFAPFEPGMVRMALMYLGLHAALFTGAIVFRSNSGVKTLVSVMAIWCSVFLVMFTTVRILYWDRFPKLWSLETTGNIPFLEPPEWTLWAAGAALATWILYVAYQCLRDHEVQGEL